MSDHRDEDIATALNAKERSTLLERYRIRSGHGFKLADYQTDEVFPKKLEKRQGEALLAQGVKRLADLQEKLYAKHTWSLLIVLQAMDAGGKDSTIEHVLSGVNPQGVTVTSFKAPTADDLAHDFLWRIVRALPARGMIGVFNRSHYEDVLVTRVHPDLIERAHLPAGAATDPQFWDRRLVTIAAFERHLANEGTKIVKIHLNLGRDEQKKRLLARLEDPDKTWKFDPGDLKERALWPAYHDAYQAAIAATAADHAPWFVVPADHKWFARLVVVEAIVAALSDLDLTPAPMTGAHRAALKQAQADLEAS